MTVARRVEIIDGKVVDAGPMGDNKPPIKRGVRVVWVPPSILKKLPARRGRRLVDITFRTACERAHRSGNLSEVIALLGSQYPLTDLDELLLADLLEAGKFTLKRRRGNPRRPNEQIAFAVDLAKWWKKILYQEGWKRRKGGRSIDEIVVDLVISQMVYEGSPMPGAEMRQSKNGKVREAQTFKDRVLTEMHRSRAWHQTRQRKRLNQQPPI